MHKHSQAFSQELHIQLEDIRIWLNIRAHELGFGQLRISDTDVSEAAPKLASWLAEGRHGEMGYMERHASCAHSLSSYKQAPFARSA